MVRLITTNYFLNESYKVLLIYCFINKPLKSSTILVKCHFRLANHKNKILRFDELSIYTSIKDILYILFINNLSLY